MAYKKPQDPLTNNGFGIYPLTTADQVILSDGSRLEKNGVVSVDVATAADSSKLDGNTLAEIMLMIYPVGAIYISTVAASPASLFGGTWEQIKDRFLLSAGSTYAAGSTGGEANHTLTTNEIPSHNHSLVRQQWYAADSVVSSMSGSIFSWKSNEGGTTSGSYTNTYDIGYTGGSNPHNNLPPYLAVYMWKRVS